ncbi:hypothetical protein DPMN_009177 [Dreissena polymorpha]|uniref:Uncharacterized protein n=1 Tax=Dreissena polymorpha TaxID=45954 RepID=A0A9D4MZ46_DREPO|nr:hypothetical protein DPMN_009177 [Dreissena polymorpha]
MFGRARVRMRVWLRLEEFSSQVILYCNMVILRCSWLSRVWMMCVSCRPRISVGDLSDVDEDGHGDDAGVCWVVVDGSVVVGWSVGQVLVAVMTVVVEDVAVTVDLSCWLVAESLMVTEVGLSGGDCLADDGSRSDFF